MAQVNFKLEVVGDGANVKFTPTVDCNQKLGWALNEFQGSVANFSFKTGNKFGLPPYLTQVMFGNKTLTKHDNSFWQILVNNNNVITPVGLFNYKVKGNDQIILRYTTV